MENILKQLETAILAIYSPETQQSQRYEAYQAIENFKEKSEHVAQCGLAMAEPSNPNPIRHFGLKLIEHYVKVRWYVAAPDEKSIVRDKVMHLITRCEKTVLEEEAAVLDAYSRIIVEMMKREWPQHWPNLMNDLQQITLSGETQTEIVLLILLRLVEDVVSFQKVPNPRRKDMMTGLSENMGFIFNLFRSTLQDNLNKYKAFEAEGRETSQVRVKIHCHVLGMIMKTMMGYIDWVPMSHLTAENAILLQMLFSMLADKNLHIYAADCLLTISNRRGVTKEREALFNLFDMDSLAFILNGAKNALGNMQDENQYVFLKKICEVITSLGTMLTSIWTADNDQGPKSNLATYLEALIVFTQHDSLFLAQLCVPVWVTFLRHEQMKNNAHVQAHLPVLLEVCRKANRKVGYTSKNNDPRCFFSKIDYEDDSDFQKEYSSYKSKCNLLVKCIALVQPSLAYDKALNVLQSLLATPFDQDRPADELLVIEWGAAADLAECCVLGVESIEEQERKPPSQPAFDVLCSLLQIQTKDPNLLSKILSCISALFPYISHSPNIIPMVLDKIFSAAVFNLDGETKYTRSYSLRSLRQHACAVMIKLGKTHPKLLLSFFDQLYGHIKKLTYDPDDMSALEKQFLIQGLLLICNEFKSFQKQSAFIEDVLLPVKEIWSSKAVLDALGSCEKFMSFCGLDRHPSESCHPREGGSFDEHRGQIFYGITMIHAIIKRSQYPDDIEEARAGGFIILENNKEVRKNPAMAPLGSMLESVLVLLRIFNEMWKPERLAQRHEGWRKSFDMQSNDREAALGIVQVTRTAEDSECVKEKSPEQRMWTFLGTTLEYLMHILASACTSFGIEFYTLPNLSSFLLNTAFSSIENIPIYRLKPLIRLFLKHFVAYCPSECFNSTVLPVLVPFCPYILQVLQERWNTLHTREKEGYDENEEEIIIDDHLTRTVTREYIEVLDSVLLRNSKCNESRQEMEKGEGTEETLLYVPSQVHMGTNGKLILASPALPPIVEFLFSALSWNDTIVCQKSLTIAPALVKEMHESGLIGPEECKHIFVAILQSLHVHGEHDALMVAIVNVAVHIYDLLIPTHPEIDSDILTKLPDFNETLFLKFKALCQAPGSKSGDKKKRDTMRKLLEPITGKNIGQKFRDEVIIANLPPVIKEKRARKAMLLPEDTPDLGICSLFKP